MGSDHTCLITLHLCVQVFCNESYWVFLKFNFAYTKQISLQNSKISLQLHQDFPIRSFADPPLFKNNCLVYYLQLDVFVNRKTRKTVGKFSIVKWYLLWMSGAYHHVPFCYGMEKCHNIFGILIAYLREFWTFKLSVSTRSMLSLSHVYG